LRSEAALAALCGVNPLPASSGKTVRHRLNRGGDRQANNALWTIAMVRMRSEPRTRAYVERRTAEGLSNKEIHRCLKRYIIRELYPLILADLAAPTGISWHRSVNAVAERFFLNLKMERVWQRQYANHAEAKADITDYIVGFYNCKRINSALGNLPPSVYEQKMAEREPIVVSEITWPPQIGLCQQRFKTDTVLNRRWQWETPPRHFPCDVASMRTSFVTS
jgi:transposase InsO family protein